MINYFKDIKLRPTPTTYNMIIEIAKGTDEKYELKPPHFNYMEMVRRVNGKYPYYYGCFPQTYADDKDPMDCILITEHTYSIGSIVEVNVIGVINTVDYGEGDPKILAIPVNEDITNVSKYMKDIFAFLKTYKGKDADTVIDKSAYIADEAIKMLNKSHRVFIDSQVTSL